MAIEQLEELEHHAGAADRRRLGPGREGGGGGGNGTGHILPIAQAYLARHGAGGGVENRLGPLAAAKAALAGDVLGDFGAVGVGGHLGGLL